jgi:NAD(P)-dependent dehydrogenase (short-subunit alcohol dehydrogenase family)
VIKDWQDIMAVNLNGVFNVRHAFLAQLRATRGRIINIGSNQSFVHVRTPNSPTCTTSKHGVLGFTRALAAELGKDGVRVNAIGPGLIEMPLNEKVGANNPELVRTSWTTRRSAAPESLRTSSGRRSSSPPTSRPTSPVRSSWLTAATDRFSGDAR